MISNTENVNEIKIVTCVEPAGYWGAQSILLKENSTLYQLKKRFIEKLRKHDIVNDDNRNSTPHIEITTREKKKDQEALQKITNLPVTLTNDTMRFYRNYVDIKIDCDTVSNCHFTLFFKKNISEHKSLVQK